MKPYSILTIFVSLILVISACNLPGGQQPTEGNPNVVFTAAAQTVEAQLTQSALLLPTSAPATPSAPVETTSASTSTSTPLPLPQATTSAATAAATAACDAAQFIADVTIPDGTKFNGGEAFTKTWQFKNIGTCTWDTSYTLVFDTGELMSGPASVSLPGSIAPGQQVDLSVTLVAPSANGTYRGYWRLRNGAGTFLPITSGYNGKSFFVEIQVKEGSVDSGGKFAVTSVGFSVSRDGTCASGKYIVTATVTTNKAGQVTYTWVRSDGASGPSNNGTLDFDNASSKTISFEWSTSASGLWVDLYVDKPNHQQFGRATLNCP